MPTIGKQSTAAKAKPAPVVQSEVSGVKALLFGRGKTGKTSLACTFPKPLLLVGTEDGTKSICTSKKEKAKLKSGAVLYALKIGAKDLGIDFIRLSSLDDMDEVVELYKTEYETGVMDHGGGLQDMVVKDVLGLSEIPLSRSWGMAKQQDWGTIGAQTKERLRRFLDVADQYGKNAVTIAHERNFNEDSNASEIISPTIGAALTPSVVGWLNGIHDYICQLYIREQTRPVENKVGDKTVTMVQKTGKVEYCLRVGAHPVYMTGFRVPRGIVLPECVVDPSYEKIVTLIQGGKL